MNDLQELIYFKDASRLLFGVRAMQIDRRDERCVLKATLAGEQLDPTRHQQRADVKAVTLHNFSVQESDTGWRARVLLDI